MEKDAFEFSAFSIILSSFPIIVLITIWIIAFVLLERLILESEKNKLPRFTALLASSMLCYYFYFKNLFYDYLVGLNKFFSNWIILIIAIILAFSFGLFLGWFLSGARKVSSDRKIRLFIFMTSFYLGFMIVNFCKSKFLRTPFMEFTVLPSFGMLIYYTFWREERNKKEG